MPDDPMYAAHAAISADKTAAHASGDTSHFMANAAAGITRMIEAGPIGRPLLGAAQDAWDRFHGPGPDKT